MIPQWYTSSLSLALDSYQRVPAKGLCNILSELKPSRFGRSISIPSSVTMDAQVLADWAECDKTDTLFVVICSVICWGIIPAVGLGYSGYSTRHNSLASFFPALLAVICVSLQWYILGYSLAYGEGNAFIGDLKHAFHQGVLAQPVGTIPAILFSEFQLVFAATVAAIAIGGACERGRLLPLVPFLFVSRIATSCHISVSLANVNW
jgi:Amt family ammonium transporter